MSNNTANARAARLLNVALSSMDPGDAFVKDVRGFSSIRVALSSGSSGGTLTVARVVSLASTANPSTGYSGIESLAGSSEGASTSLSIDWPYYRFALSTGSTAAGAYVALS